MSKIEHSEFKTELQIKAIDIIEYTIKLPQQDVGSPTLFNFNVGVETRMNPAEQAVLVLVNIDVTTPDQKLILASIKTGCQFWVSNFEEIIKIKAEEAPFIPQTLLEVINSISISTTRGILYGQFKGTFLHSAILPILDPKSFKQQE